MTIPDFALHLIGVCVAIVLCLILGYALGRWINGEEEGE